MLILEKEDKLLSSPLVTKEHITYHILGSGILRHKLFVLRSCKTGNSTDFCPRMSIF